jgi:hypothetical protein
MICYLSPVTYRARSWTHAGHKDNACNTSDNALVSYRSWYFPEEPKGSISTLEGTSGPFYFSARLGPECLCPWKGPSLWLTLEPHSLQIDKPLDIE